MRNNVSACKVFVVFVFAIYSASSYAAETRSYPLFCKGGSNMILKLRPDTSQGGTAILLSFKRGTRPATRGVKSGECAWSDRGVSSNEPMLLTFYDRNIYIETRMGPGKNVSFTAYERRRNSNQSNAVSKVLKAIQTGREFQVYAYARKNRSGRRSLEISRFGP